MVTTDDVILNKVQWDLYNWIISTGNATELQVATTSVTVTYGSYRRDGALIQKKCVWTGNFQRTNPVHFSTNSHKYYKS